MRTRIPSFLFVDWVSRPAQNPKRIFVLLHGYEQTGQKIFDKLEPSIPSDAMVIAPNAPFLIPRRSEDTLEAVYSWYFYNPKTDEYVIDTQIAAHMISSLVRELGLESVPTTLIGFSQGGYVAPFAAALMPQVDHVVGIGCQFLHEELSLPVLLRSKCRMDQIHGSMDETVGPENAQESHAALRKAGIPGEFHMLEQSSHRIDAAVRAKLIEVLAHFGR